MSIAEKLTTIAENEREIKEIIDNTADAIRSKMYNPNLYDAESYPMTDGKYINTTNGVAYESTLYAYTNDYIPCTELCGKFITINHVSGNIAGIAFYDADKKYISGVAGGSAKQIKTTIPETASYYRFCVLVEYIDMAKVEEGDTATEYTPFGYRPLINAQDFPEKVNEVYDKGMDDKESEFWNRITDSQSRKVYDYAFSRWDGEYIRPPYKITPTGTAHHIMLSCPNLKKIEKDYFDFSKVSGVYNNGTTGIGTLCNGCSKLEEIEDVNFPDWHYYQAFANCPKLHTIARLVVSENTQIFSDAFRNCPSLQNIIIDGTLTRSVDFSYSSLTPESMISVITALKNYVGTGNEGVYSAKFTEECWLALEAYSTAPDGGTWTDYYLNKGWKK